MATVAKQTGELKLLGAEALPDGIPSAFMGCESVLVGSVAVYSPIIRTRQLSALSKRGFAFTIEDAASLYGLTSGRGEAPQTTWLNLSNGISAFGALEVVIVSQGDLYAGTTLTRGDYTLVCVPMLDLPSSEQIYSRPWGGSGPPPTPEGGFRHDINGVYDAASAVVLSATVQDAHTDAGNWTNPLETVLPISGANAAAFAALLERGEKWRRRNGPFQTGNALPVRTYITARAPYLTGGAGCNLNILGAYLRAVYTP